MKLSPNPRLAPPPTVDLTSGPRMANNNNIPRTIEGLKHAFIDLESTIRDLTPEGVHHAHVWPVLLDHFAALAAKHATISRRVPPLLKHFLVTPDSTPPNPGAIPHLLGTMEEPEIAAHSSICLSTAFAPAETAPAHLEPLPFDPSKESSSSIPPPLSDDPSSSFRSLSNQTTARNQMIARLLDKSSEAREDALRRVPFKSPADPK